MINLKEKRGLSTIISTLLLIVLAITIASILFASYRSIIEKERVKTEFENKCMGIEISASAAGNGTNIINIGNEDVEGIAIKRLDSEAEKIIFEEALESGGVDFVNFTGDEIIPIFKNGDEFYICRDKSFAIVS